MEPVGLAVGLVGLFSTCMDVLQRVDSYRTAGRDSRQLDAQLNATMHLFERWGDGVGISKGKLSDNHHPDLDNPRTHAVVQGLLNSIKDFSTTSNEPPSPKGLQKTPSFPISGDVSSHGSKISRWQKTAWALRGKLKQTSHVQALAGLVSDLYNVVSPDTTGSKALTRTSSFKDLSINAGEQPYAVEVRELLQKIEEEMEGNDSSEKRVKETCEWILHRDEFLQWQKPSSSSKLLWIKGPAGFGKTVLCARIVQELEKTAQELVAYFFLSSRYDGRDDPFSAIRAWLTMMIQRSPGARDIVAKARLLQHEPLASQASILRAFREVIVGAPGCILALDGLDESTGMANKDKRSVPHFLQELRIATTNTTAKILISSRGDPLIHQCLSDFAGYSEYAIHPDDVGPDLMAYSTELVKAKLPNKDELTRASIASKMKDRSEGQFQWVKLQEGSLRKGRSRKQLEREIDETPSGLDSLYDREWNRINAMGDSDKLRALSLLQWTAFAFRPLTVYQITEAVLITDEMDELPLDEMPDCVDQDYVDSMILELCGSLIEVRRVSPSESTENPEHIHQSEEDSIGLQEVHLSHFSVKEYLLLKTFPGTNALLSNEKLRVSNEEFHNATLAKHCLRFMNMRGAFEGLEMNKIEESGKQHFIFYAVDFGYPHCRDVKAIDLELHQVIIASMDGRNNNWNFMKDLVETEIFGDDPDLQDSSISPFVLAIFSKITDAVAHFIREESLDINDRSFGNSTPLFWACCSGNKDIVELLVDSGADINARCHQGRVPLHISVGTGNHGITELLISKGADVSVVNEERQTPLDIALMDVNTKIARLLIDKGADVASEDNSGRNLLHLACGSGDLDLVKFIINASQTQALEGVLDDADHWGSTPLSFAARFGRVGIIRVLIDTGAVAVESSDIFGRTAKFWATSRGHDTVARLLSKPDGHRNLGTGIKEVAVQEQSRDMRAYCDICWLSIYGQAYAHCGIFSSLITTLLAGSMVNAKYTVEIPEDAVWVTNWDELQAAPRFAGVLLPKYGGFVIEVDEKIVLATDEQMSKKVLDLLTDLEKNEPQPEDEQTTPNKRDVEIRGYGNRYRHEPTDPEAICCNSEEGIAYKDFSPEQKEISDILRNMDRDPDLLGLADLGKDGVFRFLDADRNIHYAIPLRPALIKALIDRLPHDPEVEKFWRGVDGTKVPEEEWYNPAEGILPPPLTEEERREEREIMEKNKDKIDQIREDLKNGIHRKRLVFIESDNKLE
ncbi:ankyrin repeat domain-containing protein [Fusarium pseudocircinatum]|uniref:Ankyrin repeat domain-containing protein n=1 Tax=Fusarium pseudocircinatum TaxID=56676 RepID=A0A8H5L056_9HYPO|nr:ankyrin repeat domain-containing protein [Fusarium pseudocircinatum]